ncbi:IclR family transcriptional regulator [Micromonospora sp. WMMD1082]|uniref:IclR family transcriptional regulator n=1 Tax=Micromonospora sp. WMMD1082 TaxID=3016104 RepID=UPI002415DE92|nr:IclR family transcriptional regulator [Micromonospora sp. WMMD1082]MDG4798373.1 IclR family transcriptional regulator [Micromonospora sp. WMMD1082]
MRARDPLGRAIHVLRWMAEQPAPFVGVREIATALGMQPSTVSRLLASLAEERLVRRDPRTSGFAPGLELMRLGVLASQKLDVRAAARVHMRTLADQCNESVFLGLFDPSRQELFRVETVSSNRPLRYVVEMDQWTKIYLGASGLGVLAFLPDAQRELGIRLADAAAGPDRPWLRRAEFEPMLDRIRAQGYAITFGMRIPDAVGVSAPVFAEGGRVLGSVILTVPKVRIGEHDQPQLARLITETAAAITHDIGGSRPDYLHQPYQLQQ